MAWPGIRIYSRCLPTHRLALHTPLSESGTLGQLLGWCYLPAFIQLPPAREVRVRTLSVRLAFSHPVRFTALIHRPSLVLAVLHLSALSGKTPSARPRQSAVVCVIKWVIRPASSGFFARDRRAGRRVYDRGVKLSGGLPGQPISGERRIDRRLRGRVCNHRCVCVD